jgi:hypothetical protein
MDDSQPKVSLASGPVFSENIWNIIRRFESVSETSLASMDTRDTILGKSNANESTGETQRTTMKNEPEILINGIELSKLLHNGFKTFSN